MGPTTKTYISIIFTYITLTVIGSKCQSQTKENVNSTTESLIAALAQYDFSFGNKTHLISQNPSRDEEILEIYDNKTLNLNESKYCIQSILAKTIFFNDSTNDAYRMELSWKAETKMRYLKLQGHHNSENNSNCDFENKLIYTTNPEDKDRYTFRHKDRFISITPTCTYKIRVAMRGECDPFALKYTIPVCLEGMDGKCFKCVNDTLMPAPKLLVSVKTEGVIVHWKLPKIDKEILNNTQKIVIIIDPVRTLPSEQRMVKEILLDAFVKNFVRNGTYYFRMNKTERLKHQVVAQLVDVFDCPGEKAELNFDFPSMAPATEYSSTTNEVWIILVFFLLFFLVLSIIYIYIGRCNTEVWKRLMGRHQRNEDNFMNNNRLLVSDLETRLVANPMYSAEPIKDSYLIDYRDLNIIKRLGGGEFGEVYLAEAIKDIKGHKKVAVKQIRETAPLDQIDDFIEEIKIFREAGHHENVVKMLGYCKEPLSIVMEYLVLYDLKSYLENLRNEFNRRNGSIRYVMLQHSCSYPQSSESSYIQDHEIESRPEVESKPDDPLRAPETPKTPQKIEFILDNKELESFSLQIARGMEHLEKRNIVHRDLAARNILMDRDKRLKISDFGMSRIGIYVNKRSKKVPLRWMAPEAVEFLTFSNKSDVWSYGVVLWEIGTLAAFPYGGLTDRQVITFLKKGGHLDQPENITAQLYEIMLDCWTQNPDERPTFGELVQKLEKLYSVTHAYVDFSNLKSNYVFPPTEAEVEGKKKKNGTVNQEE